MNTKISKKTTPTDRKYISKFLKLQGPVMKFRLIHLNLILILLTSLNHLCYSLFINKENLSDKRGEAILKLPLFNSSVLEGVLISPKYILTNIRNKDLNEVTVVLPDGKFRKQKIKGHFEFPTGATLYGYNAQFGFSVLETKKPIFDVPVSFRARSFISKRMYGKEDYLDLIILGHKKSTITTYRRELGTNLSTFTNTKKPFIMDFSGPKDQLRTPFECSFDDENASDYSAPVYIKDRKESPYLLAGILSGRNTNIPMQNPGALFAGEDLMGAPDLWIDQLIARQILKTESINIPNLVGEIFSNGEVTVAPAAGNAKDILKDKYKIFKALFKSLEKSVHMFKGMNEATIIALPDKAFEHMLAKMSYGKEISNMNDKKRIKLAKALIIPSIIDFSKIKNNQEKKEDFKSLSFFKYTDPHIISKVKIRAFSEYKSKGLSKEERKMQTQVSWTITAKKTNNKIQYQVNTLDKDNHHNPSLDVDFVFSSQENKLQIYFIKKVEDLSELFDIQTLVDLASNTLKDLAPGKTQKSLLGNFIINIPSTWTIDDGEEDEEEDSYDSDFDDEDDSF